MGEWEISLNRDWKLFLVRRVCLAQAEGTSTQQNPKHWPQILTSTTLFNTDSAPLQQFASHVGRSSLAGFTLVLALTLALSLDLTLTLILTLTLTLALALIIVTLLLTFRSCPLL